MIYHLTAFIAGFILDLFLGDPIGWPHPIRWIGSMIGSLSDSFLKRADRSLDIEAIPRRKRIMGVWLVVIVITMTAATSFLILHFAYTVYSFLGVIIESVMTYYCLAAKSLWVESMKVSTALEKEGLQAGRSAVSMIVGRDLAIGGPVLGFVYKAINTMDSMVGYKNDKYMDFGKAAAKLDDVVNYIPSRLSAILMIVSCLFLGHNYSAIDAFKIFRRDRYNHASPNSAQTESACAGALGLRLAGPASYFGKIVDKKYIGDSVRNIELADIKRANILMVATASLCELICAAIMVLIVL